MEGYVIDAIPSHKSVILVLDNFRRVKIRATFPIYVKTDKPEIIAQHPSVLSYEEEMWRDLEGRDLKLYRFELSDINAYNYIKDKSREWGYEVVNELPTVLAQALYRLNAYPFRKVRVAEDGSKVELIE